MDWTALRAQYRSLAHWTYFNSATYGLVSDRSREAIIGHLDHRDELACSDFLGWFNDIDEIRGLAARLINARPEDIAFTLNAASALSLFLGNIDWQAGDRIVTLTDEFPNQVYYASLLHEKGVEFLEVSWSRFLSSVNDRTRAVILSQVSYSTGFAPPLEEIGPWLKKRGVLLYVDTTQALGAATFDVGRVQPAMMAANAYKWLLAPNGAAFMYVSPELRAVLEPNVIGWRSHRDWRNVNRLHHGAPEFSPNAEKYEGGMPAFPSLYAFGAALETFLEVGPAAIENRIAALNPMLHEGLEQMPGVRVRHKNSPITAARFENHDPAILVGMLKQRRILASARHDCLRLSLHFYNNEEDIETLLSALRSVVAG